MSSMGILNREAFFKIKKPHNFLLKNHRVCILEFINLKIIAFFNISYSDKHIVRSCCNE